MWTNVILMIGYQGQLVQETISVKEGWFSCSDTLSNLEFLVVVPSSRTVFLSRIMIINYCVLRASFPVLTVRKVRWNITLIKALACNSASRSSFSSWLGYVLHWADTIHTTYSHYLHSSIVAFLVHCHHDNFQGLVWSLGCNHMGHHLVSNNIPDFFS